MAFKDFKTAEAIFQNDTVAVCVSICDKFHNLLPLAFTSRG